jgi:hypothetical protein
MVGVNRYFRRSKISEARFRDLVRCFALDLTATQTAAVTGISVRSVNAIFLRIRVRMAEACARNSPFQGEVEADESYFGPRRVRGKRGRGAGGKTMSSACSSAETRSTPRSCRMPRKPPCKRSFAAK